MLGGEFKIHNYIPAGLLHGVYFNERLHWFWRSTSSGDEVFREVALPTSFDNCKLGPLVLGSCLCLVVSPFEGDAIEVRMMKKYGVRESWTKFMMAKHWMGLEDVLYLAAEEEFVLRTCEMIEEVNGVGIIDESSLEKLVVYNPKKETLWDMVVCGIPTDNYIETLISPNHGGRIWRHCEAS
ncbi:hypothetical protein RHMOL_Rhmol02G0092800 [Rhododendron molle]|uniref:Uncharacterized protein n=1 Tax=Rhododendron molle TaxID=49168 RepID=A0ACC0PQU7_RHOML|nr:hypothetical protein RHMOL_Rhmol02G0092800 [Rhododendron molle]